jgi:bifunctional non-homologous end joining protein LigD
MIIKVDGRQLEISNADKVLFPGDGITEGDLAKYYARVAQAMLPHVRGRPIMMQRFPRGIRAQPIIQQRAPEHFPSWVKRATVKRVGGGHLTHAVIANSATLVYLADQACITPHVWLSRADKPEQPDQMIFDLDPPAADFALASTAAHAIRDVLDDVGLAAFVKTTGGKGLHVQVPLDRRAGFDEVRAFARDVAELVILKNPKQFTTEQRKSKRRGRLYLDVIRNAYGQTAVAPYAVRARQGAPVATPLAWEELSEPGLSPDDFTLKTVPGRVARRADPWRQMARRSFALGPARRRLNRLIGDV